MKKRFLIACVLALLSIGAWAQGTNPVAEFYPDGYPAWTDNIKWDNVINMKTDARITAISGEWARYEKGVELLGDEGGVLYYPAGTYKFTDIPAGENGAREDGQGIMLRSGVVIMGEKPGTRQIASDVNGGLINLGTVIEFPTYSRTVLGAGDIEMQKETPGHWNFVGLKTRPGQELKDVDNVGVCFVNFKNGGVYWGAQYVWAASYQDPNRQSYGAGGCDADKGWMPNRVADGTHYADPFGGCLKRNVNGKDGTEYVGAGEGRLILACRFDNAILLDAGGYKGTFKDGYNKGANAEYEGLSLEPYRFAGRITIDASNIFIAASAITKPTNAFLYKANLQMASKDPIGERDNQSMMLSVPQLFDPAKHIGMDICKGILGLVSEGQRTMLDDQAPFYETNIVIRDNYVYSHGNKGFEISGRWAKVLNNVNDRDFLNGGTIPSKNSPNTLEHVGDAKQVYGLTDVIPYKIRSGQGTVDVPGAEGHYIARISSLRGTNQTDDNMSRAFDYAGSNVWFDGNRYWGTGSWPGNDGEGILCQETGKVSALSVAITNNEAIYKVTTGSPKSGYMATWGGGGLPVIGGLWYKNKGGHSEWTAGTWAVSDGERVEEIAVVGNTRNGTPVAKTDFKTSGTKGPYWADVVSGSPAPNSIPEGGVQAPKNVKAVYNEEGGYVEVSWDPDYTINGDIITDNNNEIGYRVERRREGSSDWTVVAYRPLQNGYKVLGGINRTYNGKDTWTLDELDLNPPVWRDYERVAGKAEYRVVAVGATPDKDVVQAETPIVVDFNDDNSVTPTEPSNDDVLADMNYEFTNYTTVSDSKFRLWIPPTTQKVRGVLVAFTQMQEVVSLDPEIRKACMLEDLAIVWASGLGENDYNKLATGLNQLAEASGMPELATAPFATIAHSTAGIFCRTIAAANPDRCFAIIQLNAVDYRDNAELKDIPWMTIKNGAEETEDTWEQARYFLVNNKEAYTNPDGSHSNDDKAWTSPRGNGCHITQVSLVGGRHFGWSPFEAKLVSTFIRKAAQYQLSADGVITRIPENQGWLTDTAMVTKPKYATASYDEYQGDPKKAFWHIDEEMATLWQSMHQEEVAKLPQTVSQSSFSEGVWTNSSKKFDLTNGGITTPYPYMAVCSVAENPIKVKLYNGLFDVVNGTDLYYNAARYNFTGTKDWITFYQEGTATHRYAEVTTAQVQAAGMPTAATVTTTAIADQNITTASVPYNATSSGKIDDWVVTGNVYKEGNNWMIDPFTSVPKLQVFIRQASGRSTSAKETNFNIVNTRTNQTVTFNAGLPSKINTGNTSPIILNATATGNGAQVKYYLLYGPANLDGNKLIPTGAKGEIVVMAVARNTDNNPAKDVLRITVGENETSGIHDIVNNKLQPIIKQTATTVQVRNITAGTKLRIIDAAGKQCRQMTASSTTATISTVGLKQGVYILVVGNARPIKFIKR